LTATVEAMPPALAPATLRAVIAQVEHQLTELGVGQGPR
jgi:hypothetical protein